MPRRLAPLLALSLALAGCAAGPRKEPASPSAQALRDGPASSDPELVGRWLLAELISPGGSLEGAQRARERLARLGAGGMFAGLARGLDDASHGKLKAAGQEYLAALQASRGSPDPLAPLVAWYSVNHLLSIDGAVPSLWKEAGPWVKETIDAPQSIGWRARGELVDWWARHAFDDAESGLLDKTTARYGCAKEVRLAGPFGRAVPEDRWRSFAAEKPGPWPARWPADAQRAQAPRVLKTERSGCSVRIDEPVSAGIFYAETYLEVPASRELIIAAQGSLAVFVDDKLVLSRDVRTWGVWPSFGVHLRLEPGRHRVLARLTDPETSLRVLAIDGSPADVTSSASAAAPYSLSPPEVLADPNVLGRYLAGGAARRPKDELEAYLAAYVAAIEGQYDVANVLLEPLIAEQDKATPVSLATAASFTEKDPIFPDADARDLGRLLREKAVGRDPKLYFPRLWLLLDKADKGMSEAAGSVREMAAEFPEVPEVLRVLGTLYARLGWRAERVQTAIALVTRFPDDRAALEAAIPVYEEAGRLKEADELAARLRALHPDSEIDLDRALARHDYRAAIDELTRLGKRRPDRKDIVDRVAQLFTRAGEKVDVIASLERVLKRSARDAAARLSLADARFAGGDTAALRKALAAAIEQGASTDDLRGAIELIEGMTELEPYRIDPRAVMAAYEKDKEPLEGTAARVLDYSALWIHPDGSARMLEHELIRVQSQEAIGKLAEQRLPPGALVLRLRVLKASGAVLEPERVEGKPTVTMPHLEVGDYIETETITTTEGDGEGGKRYISPHWFFREADIAYWRSEFIVVAPRDRVLTVETTGQVPAPVVSELGPLAVRRWRVDRSPAAINEPNSVPVQEFLPSVRVGWGLSRKGQLARMLDAAGDDLPKDPRLARIAQVIVDTGNPAPGAQERARKLYRWVLANVEDGRETDGRKVVIGKSGSRAAGFLYLARALHLPVELGVVADRLQPRDEGPISSALSFSQFAIRLDRKSSCAAPAPSSGPAPAPAAIAHAPAPGEPDPQDPCAPLWFTVGDKYAPFGFLPAELRGQPAYRLVAGLPEDRTTAGGSFDGIEYDGTAELRADGSAMVDLDQRFVGRLAIGVRGTIEQLPEEQLKGVVESRLLARALPGARLVKLTVVDKDDLDRPLTLRMNIEVSSFALRRGDGLVLRPPLMLKVAGIAALEARQTPMLLPEATHSEVHFTIRLPKGARVSSPLQQGALRDGDRSLRVSDGAPEGALRLDRTLDIPAGRVGLDEYASFRGFTLAVDEATAREILIKLP